MLELDIQKLRKEGITAIAFDLDSTLVSHNAFEIDAETLKFIENINLPIYVLTNRFKPRGAAIAEKINAVAVHHASPSSRKPQERYFREFESLAQHPLNEIAFVGDRILTDVAGGNNVGMTTIFTEALGNDPWYTKVLQLRAIERFILNRLR